MRVDIVLGQSWIEVDEPVVLEKPPQLRIPVRLSCSKMNTSVEANITLEIFAWEIPLSSQSKSILLVDNQKSQETTFTIPLSGETIHLIEKQRQRSGSGDVTLNVRIECLYKEWPQQTSQRVVQNLKLVSGSGTLRVSVSEWKKVLGFEKHRLLIVDEKLFKELEELRQKWGLWSVDEALYRLVEAYRGVDYSSKHDLLVTLPNNKSLKDKIRELAENLWSEVRVASLYMDNAGSEILLGLLKNGTKVKIITRKSDNKKAHKDAIRLLKENGAEIRINNMLHARMIIFDDIAAIISSADLDSEGLDNQRQAGIYTTDRVIIRRAITFYDKIWEESRPH